MPNRALTTAVMSGSADEWRCPGCRKLLGRIRNGHLHVRFARGHEYIAALPASCTCRGCGTLNQLDR
jgi:hypothetical protein